MRRTTVLRVALLFLPLAAFAADPASDSNLRDENAVLRQRIEKLEQDLQDIKKLLQTPAPPPAAPTEPAPVVLTPAEMARLKELADSKNKPAHSGVDVKLYGYIKLDAACDNSRTSVGNYARWVESEPAGQENDNQFSMTANQTRLGMDVTAPDVGSLKTSGKVEIDFYGAGAAENKPEPLLRHAYLKAEWTNIDFSLLAGQTSDVISPLWMPTDNYTVGWWQGNIGYRRPQIRATQGIDLGQDFTAKLELAATRTITGRKFIFTAPTDPDSGDDSGFPTSQGRASLSFPMGGPRRGTVGFSGHWGAEDEHITDPGHFHTVHTWSANVDLRLPVTDWLLLQAEGFTGKNLDSYLGGIGQGIDNGTHQAIRDYGGWAAATLGPWGKWSFNLGGGFDNPHDGDFTVAPARTSNYLMFANVEYALTSHLVFMFEQSYLHTRYKAAPSGDDIREQLSAIFKF